MIEFVKSTESVKNLGFRHLNQRILFDLTIVYFILIDNTTLLNNNM